MTSKNSSEEPKWNFNYLLGKNKCESVTFPVCTREDGGVKASWMYNTTMFPNLLSHRSQNEAAFQLHQFLPLVKTNCSMFLRQFLCILYLPKCSKKVIPPCRSICQKARDDCKPTMIRFGFMWPDTLDCEQFPTDNEQLCVGSQKTLSDKKESLRNVTEPNVGQKNSTGMLGRHIYE